MEQILNNLLTGVYFVLIIVGIYTVIRLSIEFVLQFYSLVCEIIHSGFRYNFKTPSYRWFLFKEFLKLLFYTPFLLFLLIIIGKLYND